MKRLMILVLVFGLVVAACGGESSSDTSEASGTTEAAPETTAAEAPATTEAMADTTTSAAATATTESPSVPSGDAQAIVEAKTAAVQAAAPDGWTVTIDDPEVFEEEDGFIYDTCLEDDEFDIDNLDDVTAAALVANVEGPAANPPFPAPMANIEARVISDSGTASDIFTVFERLYGSDDGLTCMTDVVKGMMGDEMPAEGLEFTVEAVTLEDSDAGARFLMDFNIEGFEGGVNVEFQGAIDGDTMVVGSFITFGEEFDRDVANTLFSAAVNG